MNCPLAGTSIGFDHVARGGLSSGFAFQFARSPDCETGRCKPGFRGAYGCSLYNCTLTGNYCVNSYHGGPGGGAYECTLNNCIVYHNPDGYRGGVGNITNEPSFMNLAAADFRLGPDSPCIDAGGLHAWLTMLSESKTNLAALLGHATESVAAKTGDAVGGLLNATLGNLTELVIALTALRAGQYMLVKASIAGAIVTNTFLDLSVGIALGSASQIALFVAPVLVLVSYVLGPAPMNLQFWPGAVVMMLIATLTVALVINSGRPAWFVGVGALTVYVIFAMTLYLLPPRAQ